MAHDSWEHGPSEANRAVDSSERPIGNPLHGVSGVGGTCATQHDRALWISGPTGAGKATLARSIHAASSRAGGPLIRVDCRAGDAVMLGAESPEGEPRAESIAVLFDRARGGTIVFESIGELEDRSQLAIVQVARKSAALRSGARVIATDRRDLTLIRRLGTTRDELVDLFGGREVLVTPLHARPDDVPPIVRAILEDLAASTDRGAPFVSARAMYLLQSFPWPGNIRQLRHVLRELWSSAEDGCITGDEVERALRTRHEPDVPSLDIGKTFAEAEREMILATLRACGGSITRTANTLGLSRRTVQYRLREYAGKVGRRRPRA